MNKKNTPIIEATQDSEPVHKSKTSQELLQEILKFASKKEPKVIVNLIESDEDDVKVEPPPPTNSKLAEILDEIETENHLKEPQEQDQENHIDKLQRNISREPENQSNSQANKQNMNKNRKITKNWNFLGTPRETRFRKRHNPYYYAEVEEVCSLQALLHPDDFEKRTAEKLHPQLKKLKLGYHQK